MKPAIPGAWDVPPAAPINRIGVDRSYGWIQRHDPQGRRTEFKEAPPTAPAPRVWTPIVSTRPTFEQQLAAARARTDADPFCRIRR